MSRLSLLLMLLAAALYATPASAAGVPTETVQQADHVLTEIMAIRAKAIPERLLAEAQAVAIVPNVIKVGFIAGARRGHGVIFVRDSEGEWSLPQFVTLTGGAVGWPAGVEGSDIVLVFTTQKGIQGVMKGKFTLGAEIMAAAGPVGIDAPAAIESRQKAEIFTYSRSRGVLQGVSIDGSALEIDDASHLAFYGSGSSELPRQIPGAAAKLRLDLVHLTPHPQLTAHSPGIAGPPLGAHNPARLQALRGSLDQSSRQLLTTVSPQWQSYLALPQEVYSPDGRPGLDLLKSALARYDQVAKNAEYQPLASGAEFQRTHELLRELTDEVSAAVDSAVKLPPPPTALEHEFTGKVLEVIDGDTIKIAHGGKTETVRLLNVDAPELAQAYGAAAKKNAEALCLGDQARVVWESRDGEGRILGSVYEQDGFNVNYDMVRAGLAWELNDDQTLTELETEARRAKRGLWADRNPTSPWEFRRQHEKSSPGSPGKAAQPGTANRILKPIRW